MRSSPSKVSSPEKAKRRIPARPADASEPTTFEAATSGAVTRAAAKRLSLQVRSTGLTPQKRSPPKKKPSKSKAIESPSSKPSSTKANISANNSADKKSKCSPKLNLSNEQTCKPEHTSNKASPTKLRMDQDNNSEAPGTSRDNCIVNNEQSPDFESKKIKKKVFSSKSPIMENKNVADSQKLHEEKRRLSKNDKSNVPQVKTPISPSKCKPKLHVPRSPAVEVQLPAGNCLTADNKEKLSPSQNYISNLPPLNNISEYKDEKEAPDTLLEQCLETNAKPNAEEIIVKDTSIKSRDTQSVVDLQKVKLKSPEKEKVDTPTKKHVTPKKVVIDDKSETDDDSDAESRKEIMRSAEKRIIRNISTSESESRNAGMKQIKVSSNTLESSGSESDSAPEDVTFDVSRKTAFDIHKIAEESINREKQRKKDKRKERLEIIRQRKEENLIRLKEKKANLEDASCSSSEESVHDKNGQLNIDPFKVMGKKTYIFDDIEYTKEKTIKACEAHERQATGIKRLPSELLENLPDQFPKKKKTSHYETANKVTQVLEKTDIAKLHGSKTKRDVDFIPVASSGSTQFGVVPLNKPQLKTVTQQAADFKHNMLYGGHHDRVTASTFKKTLEKKRIALKVYK